MNNTYRGNCHCGALSWRFHTPTDPREWVVRSCQCSFCRAHGVRCTSDPQGAVDFSTTNRAAVLRYRFALSTAEFLVCRNCGVYIGAVMTQPDICFTTINLNTMHSVVNELPDSIAVSYESEDAKARVERRRLKWTPVNTEI